MNVYRAVVRSARAHPDAVAVVDADVRLDFARLLVEADAVAARLMAQGVRPGDRVAILLPNGVPYAVTYLAIQAAGAIAVLVNTRLTAVEIAHILDDSGAATAVTDNELRHLLGDPAGLAVLEAAELTGTVRDGAPPPVDPADRPGWNTPPDATANLLYTSGTTGTPKGARQTHQNLLFNIDTAIETFGITPATVTLVVAPMFHATGINSQLLPCLAAGARAVLTKAFHPVGTIDELIEHDVTLFGGVAAMIELLALDTRFSDTNVPSLRTVGLGGSPMTEHTVELLRTRFPRSQIVNVWGLTEATSIVTTATSSDLARHPGTVGRAVQGLDVIVSGEDPATDSDGDAPRGPSSAPAGTVGELLVRGPAVTAGYWDNPAATAATYVGGWLHTGDVGRINGDGYVEVLDRLKDMIIRGGENVYCLEVENALTSHPAVADAAVVGIADPIFGEQVKAIVVLDPTVDAPEDDIASHVSRLLADYKRPSEYEFVDALPRNSSGKVLKRSLASRSASASSSASEVSAS